MRSGRYNPDYDEPQWEHQYRKMDTEHHYGRDPYWDSVVRPKEKKVGLQFSGTEIRHLAIATGLLTLAFGLSTQNITFWNFTDASLMGLTVSVFVSFFAVATGFLLHEMGHKFVAQRYGCWAEFRYNMIGLIIALGMALMIGWMFAAPGAVYIRGNISKRENGIISLAGPLTNLILAVLFLPLLYAGMVTGMGILVYIGFYGMFINFFLGAFNMIPVMPFDGSKIWAWNPMVYILMAILLGAPVLFLWFGGMSYFW